MTGQMELLFDGPAYDADRDQARLTGQCRRVFAAMADQQWYTISELERMLPGDSSNSITAQFRHLRKDRFGAHTVNRRYISNGLFEYQLIPAEGFDILSFGGAERLVPATCLSVGSAATRTPKEGEYGKQN
jgi:hypothetical protein